MQRHLSRCRQNTSAECSAKAAVDESGQVAFAELQGVGELQAECRQRVPLPARLARMSGRSAGLANWQRTTTTRPPWAVSWVDYSSLLQQALYSLYRILLKFLSYGPGTAVNSLLSSSTCSYPSSTAPTGPFTPFRSTHEPLQSILVGILLYNYYLCVVTDPGDVPHSWVRYTFASTGVVHLCPFIQEPEFDDTDGYEVKKMSGTPRYCRMCRRYKPPRAHHCKTCNRYASANCNHPPI